MIGLISALFAAILWALASILYKNSGEVEHPIKLNFLKGIIALFLLTVTALINKTDFLILRNDFLLLALSGLIGIGIGDTAYFYALKLIGAQQTLLIATLAPGVTIILGGIFLNEILTIQTFFSLLISIVGIILVITAGENNKNLHSIRGYIWSLLAMSSQAIGILLSRLTMRTSAIPALSSAMVRLFFGVIFLFILILIQKRNIFKYKFESKNLFLTFLIAVFFGTFITMWLQQNALKFLEAGIAQTLLSTSPIFIAIFHIISGKKVKPQTILGILLSLIGVFVLFLL